MQHSSKPYLTITEQIKKLQGRGLLINNEGKAEHYLTQIGYYRLSGYSYAFRESVINHDGSVTILDEFKEGTSFADVHELYVFDKRLRILLLDAIERIEVSLRVAISLELGRFDTNAHLHRNFFTDNEKVEENYEKWQTKYKELVEKSKEDFAKHHKEKSIHLPIWVAPELWDFGMLSNFFSMLKDEYKKPIAARYNVDWLMLFVSWLHAVNVIRNICAHHGRMWNRVIAVKPKLTKFGQIELLDPLMLNKVPNNKIFPVICIIAYFMRIVSPNSSWKKRFIELTETFPKSPHINLGMMGIPDSWKEWELWK